MNEAMQKAGLTSTRQIKTGDWPRVRDFLSTLKSLPPPERPSEDGDPTAELMGDVSTVAGEPASTIDSTGGGALADGCLDEVMSIVKPARGCASGSVFLCKGESEAKAAFEKILGTPKYGTPGAVNDEVMKCTRYPKLEIFKPTM